MIYKRFCFSLFSVANNTKDWVNYTEKTFMSDLSFRFKIKDPPLVLTGLPAGRVQRQDRVPHGERHTASRGIANLVFIDVSPR